MANFNKVILLGNLTRDIEMRNTQSGMALAKFGMAVNRKVKDRETTCFVDLTAWGRQAEVLSQYVQKGSQLFVEGRLEYSTWESQDGGKRSKLEVVVENFQFVGSGGGSRGGGGGKGGGRSSSAEAEAGGGGGGGGGGGDVDYGDIPF